MFKNSIVSISNPKFPSMISNTKSAILAASIIEFKSLATSMNVKRRLLPLTTVIGPLTSVKDCLANCLTKDLINVVLPVPGGPTTATMTGGGSSSGVRSTIGTCNFFSLTSLERIA
ncbi:hypothetical protein WICPIJ_000347 [Wickerhamomyces pijperi]|uniref:Uncharacterized protein n=1 Tax=Wickerhamomyces pijperi TaxID=599730 RepID=A0A9P8TSQ3_WICPI|nr:hypothetical protein WICPIJ_000347 [Wickerhamomyces pijperi]